MYRGREHQNSIRSHAFSVSCVPRRARTPVCEHKNCGGNETKGHRVACPLARTSKAVLHCQCPPKEISNRVAVFGRRQTLCPVLCFSHVQSCAAIAVRCKDRLRHDYQLLTIFVFGATLAVRAVVRVVSMAPPGRHSAGRLTRKNRPISRTVILALSRTRPSHQMNERKQT